MSYLRAYLLTAYEICAFLGTIYLFISFYDKSDLVPLYILWVSALSGFAGPIELLIRSRHNAK